MNNITEVGEIVREELKKFEGTGVSKAGIARYLANKYPLHFKNEETARLAVRYHTGTNGVANKRGVERTNGIIPNIGMLPKSHADPFTLFKVNLRKPLILSDIHIPYEDDIALEAAITFGIKNKCDGVILNGDTMDMYMMSRYNKRPDKPSVMIEFESTKNFIKLMRKTFKKVIFKVGNHEDRWNAFLQNNPAVFGLDNIQLKTIIGLSDNEFVESKQPMKLGKLNLIHGHELNKGMNSPVNFAKTLFNKLGESTMAGHLHQTSEHSFTRQPSGDIVTCWSLGCLSSLNPEYSPMPQWNHGVAMVEIERDGTFYVTNKRIKNGKIY